VVRPADDPIGSSGERAEVLAGTGEGLGTESWWSWSTYFGDDFVPIANSSWNIFTQWHHSGLSGQSNAHFEVNTNTAPWTLQLRTFGGELDTNQAVFPLGSFERNRWFDFVFHVRWAPDATGFVELWLNGEQVVPLTNTPTLYFGQGVYLKQGFYRAESNVTSVLYHDGMRRGQSYADVADAGSVPFVPPLPPAPPDEEPSADPTPSTPPPAAVVFLERPKLLRGKRVRVRARALSFVGTTVSVRGPRGRLLARKRLLPGDQGLVGTMLRIRRWRGQRFVRVTVRVDGGQARPATIMLPVPKRAFARAIV